MLVPTLPPNGSRFDPVAAECGFQPVSYKRPLDPSARCHYCDNPATSRDHIVPVALAGCNSWWNLVPCCGACNQSKDDSMSTCPCRFCTRSRKLYALDLHNPSVRRKSRRKQDRRRRARKRDHLTFQIGETLQ